MASPAAQHSTGRRGTHQYDWLSFCILQAHFLALANLSVVRIAVAAGVEALEQKHVQAALRAMTRFNKCPQPVHAPATQLGQSKPCCLSVHALGSVNCSCHWVEHAVGKLQQTNALGACLAYAGS